MKKNAIYFFDKKPDLSDVKKDLDKTVKDLENISIKDSLKYVVKKLLNKIERSL